MKTTIESLEGKVWPEPDFGSQLVLTAHALRKKPLDELTSNELRVAFQENVGADLLKTMVLEVLQKEPAIDSVYFEGDLLLAVMRSCQFRNDEAFRTKIIECADRALPGIIGADTIDESKDSEANQALEPTTLAVMPCAPSRTSHASQDRGSSLTLGKGNVGLTRRYLGISHY